MSERMVARPHTFSTANSYVPVHSIPSVHSIQYTHSPPVGIRAHPGVHQQCIPFCSYGLHRLTHQWVLVEHTVEVIDAQREEITVGLRPDTGHTPGIRQQANLAKVGSIRQGCSHLEIMSIVF